MISVATFRTIHPVGTSNESYQKAIDTAIARAGATLHGLEPFGVVQHRGHIRGDQLAHQVKLRVGCKTHDVTG